MTDLNLLVDLFRHAPRQGPGGEAQTRLAMELGGLDASRSLNIADIGCGTGASALQLAQALDARVTAVDFLPEFIEVLAANTGAAGLDDRVRPLVCSMEDLPFEAGEYDVLWSEGAIYNMGFENGVSSWRPYLAPGGLLVVSEITWFGAKRPVELQDYWEAVYSEINTVSAKVAVLENCGYSPLAYFTLPRSCWLDNYYAPLREHYADFLERHSHSPEARAVVDEQEEEMTLYEKYSDHYGYGVYLARRRD